MSWPMVTLSDPMDCSLPGSSIQGIFQAKVLEWGAIAFSDQGTRDTLGSRTGKGRTQGKSLCHVSVTGTNMRHGLIIYQIKIFFLYIFNQTNTKPSWELSA